MDDLELKRDMKPFPFNIVDKGGQPAILIGYKGDTRQFQVPFLTSVALVTHLFLTISDVSFVVEELLIAIVNKKSSGFPGTLCLFIDIIADAIAPTLELQRCRHVESPQ
ncbi:uncharacterized protein HD556DRAFT_1438460 [Suillus plorans]|uniref:non-chaperonin molecular chaperone ATPase n=1 Tax=Suillus plorans TaxID=116603 RepID=A0A9P7DRN9_9AGAM|nr:uncharacterized protein HD556DRAFT_1438460 [Suillus plorans]KAG1801431.1 hypothetical protein HD556DRAFT_1438460 [Suillus plorans]